MKKGSLFLLLSGFLMTTCSTELEIVSSDVPPAVMTAFQGKYPSAEDVEWEVEKENDHLIFEAEFKMDGHRKEAHFKPDGTFLKEE